MDLRILFSQLPPWMAVKMLLFTACNRMLNPCGNTFYAIGAEDQVIDSLLGHPNTGTMWMSAATIQFDSRIPFRST